MSVGGATLWSQLSEFWLVPDIIPEDSSIFLLKPMGGFFIVVLDKKGTLIPGVAREKIP